MSGETIKQLYLKIQNVINEVDGYKDIKIELVNNMIRLYSDIDCVSKAKIGVNDIHELSYTIAEHHPTSIIIFYLAEILRTLLDEWENELNNDEIDILLWKLEKINQGLIKLKYLD